MAKSEHGIESRMVFLSTKASRLTMVLRFKNTNLDVLVGKNTLLDSIPSSDFSIFRFFT
eukprot:Pgem_evm1s19243